MWYRPETGEKGAIDNQRTHVGLALEDIDGDGIKELFAGVLNQNKDGNELF